MRLAAADQIASSSAPGVELGVVGHGGRFASVAAASCARLHRPVEERANIAACQGYPPHATMQKSRLISDHDTADTTLGAHCGVRPNRHGQVYVETT